MKGCGGMADALFPRPQGYPRDGFGGAGAAVQGGIIKANWFDHRRNPQNRRLIGKYHNLPQTVT